ncbi:MULTISPECIES: xanthine dehydrogenase family protein molybdopterin-binding subunit [Rhodomicrobium]|uniref:xanthine dehydrogenase family protein molybdopterin-binding subunit n=1 Tax=Rhodomicrobium TaxID=1068 RepID=UPI000B4B19FE|nr:MULTISPECIES: xanthine dehydrogenase family protein molybdopterin-binding subunit [Rhodomicrobium]
MSEVDNRLVMDQPVERNLLDRGKQGVVGKGLDRVDGPLKVTGRARYSYEEPVENVAYGIVLTSEIGHGRIAGIDAETARAAPGVIAVIVDHPLLPSDGASGTALPRTLPQIENYGQAIGILVAETLEAARSAAHLVRVEYRPEPGRFDMMAHIDELEHEPPTRLVPDQHKGDLDAALAESAIVFDATYTTPFHLPVALEPHAAIAIWTGDKVEIHSSLQLLKGSLAAISASLQLDPANVRILSPYIGGGFGGKTGVGPETVLAAIAAREIGRPVKVAVTRRQTAHLVHHRCDTRQRIRIGCTADGNILAIGHESIVTQKKDRIFIEPVSIGSFGLYAGDARRFTQSVVRLDLPQASAVRAPGEAVGMLTLETAMDELAEQLGLDPIEFRKRNEPAQNPLRGVPFSTRRLIECYDEGARRFGWDQRNPVPGETRDGEWLVGMGMAAAVRNNLLVESQARVRLTPEGRAIVETDMTDIGTGTYTILAQIAGEMLGLPLDRVEIRLGDTDFPHAAGSGGSFGAAASGSSVALACEEIIGRLAALMDATPEQLTLQDGIATARNRRKPLAELLDGKAMEALGTIQQGKNGQAFSQASYGAQFAEVAVNGVTGETRVRRLLGVFDCGRILNAKTARSQAVGGMIWGLSYALHEEAVVDTRSGAFVTRDLAEYHVAANADVPQIEAYFLDATDPYANPLGVKGIGELTVGGTGAAIANAIYNACGVRAREFPLTLDRLLQGLPPV